MKSQPLDVLQPVSVVAAIVCLDVFAVASRIDFLFSSPETAGCGPVMLEFIRCDEKSGQAAS